MKTEQPGCAAPSVLLPRPQKQAQASAQKLRQNGFAAFIVPLSKIRPLPFTLPEGQNFTALLAGSANAFSRPLPAELKRLPLYCVGAKTAAAAARRGFAPRIAAAKASALIGALKQAAGQSGAFRPLYLAGRPRRPLLENFLKEAGIPFHTAELYEARARAPSAAQKAALPPKLDFILLYSGQNAAGLERLAAYISPATQILCLSARIAAAVPLKWRKQTQTAAAPNEAALLALLAKQRGARPCPPSAKALT